MKQIRQTTIHATFTFTGKHIEEREHGEVEDPERKVMDKIEAALAELHEQKDIASYEVRFIQ